MKLKYSFESMELDDQIMAIPVGQGAESLRCVIKLNESAAQIFKLLSKETTEEAIVIEMQKLYGDDSKIADYVHDMIVRLNKEGMLE